MRLAEFAEMAEAREALWRAMKKNYPTQVQLPNGFTSKHFSFVPLGSMSCLVQFIFIWDISFTDDLDIKTTLDLVPKILQTLPSEASWLQSTSKHFRILATRKGVQDALETFFNLI